MPSACQGDELLGRHVEKLVTSRAEVEVDKRQQSESQQWEQMHVHLIK